MTPLQATLYAVGSVCIFWAALVGVASVVAHSRVRWWVTPMGRHLMAYMTVIAAVLVLSCVRILLGDSVQFQVLRMIVFVGVPVVMTHRLWLQIRAQRSQPPAGPVQGAGDDERRDADRDHEHEDAGRDPER